MIKHVIAAWVSPSFSFTCRKGELPEFVYRGLHHNHPALAAAKSEGFVFAADPSARLSAGVHWAGTLSGESQFVSFSFDYEVALKFAGYKSSAGMGIVIRVPFYPPLPGDTWRWVYSPGEETEEQEVLLEGYRLDAEVIYDGSV